MKHYSEFYNQLRNTIRISDIIKATTALTRKGNEFLGICPFHEEKTPSFTVNDVKKFYHCFGCGAHGDLIRFVSETSGLGYREAAIKIAEDKGIAPPQFTKSQIAQYEEADHITQILELATEFFSSNITDEVKTYLKQRGLTEKIISDFNIGFSPGASLLEKFFQKKSIPLKDLIAAGLLGKKEDGRIYEIFTKRIIFPIRSNYNKVVAFGARALGDAMPKYINSPETIVFKKSDTIYGENLAISSAYKSNYFILVEGYLDVIALHQAGFKETVACLGTAVTTSHLSKLWTTADEIIICLDGDSAGIRASNRIIDIVLPILTVKNKVSFIKLPPSMDPDDLIKSKGPDEFQRLLAKRISLSEMIWNKEFSDNSFKSAEERAFLENRLDEYCKILNDSSLKTNFRRYFKQMLWDNVFKVSSLTSKKKAVPAFLSANMSLKKYSEMEFIELAICAFMISFPEVIKLPFEVTFRTSSLNDFKDWIINIVESSDNDKLNLQTIINDKVKNSRFYDIFLVLSAPNKLFLDDSFISKATLYKELAFELLLKKHYLLLLKQEYIELSEKEFEKAQSKSQSYLKEIQKLSEEVMQLSTKLSS